MSWRKWIAVIGTAAVIVVGILGIVEAMHQVFGDDDTNRIWRVIVSIPLIYGWAKLVEVASLKRLREMR